MEQVLNFLRDAGVYYLATADGDQPHVRPIGFVMDWNGKPAFCTGNKKDMCRQLAANPKVEICAYHDSKAIRICGKAVFVTSPESQAKALEVMPALGKIYSVGDGIFEIFCLEDVKACFSDMLGNKQEIEL